MIPASIRIEPEGWKLISYDFKCGNLSLLLDIVPFGTALSINTVFYVWGDVLAGAFSASMWQSVQPFIALGMSWFIGIEQITSQKVIGCVLVFFGVAFKGFMTPDK